MNEYIVVVNDRSRVTSLGDAVAVYGGRPSVALNKATQQLRLTKGESVTIKITNLGPHRHVFIDSHPAVSRLSPGRVHKCPCGSKKVVYDHKS